MNIIAQLIEVIILKRRASDVSYDPMLAALAFIASIATTYFQVISSNQIAQAASFVLAQGILHALMIIALLSFAKKQQRIIQTITTLFGVSAIIQLLAVFLVQVPILAGFVLLLTVWNFYLMVAILRDSLECSVWQSLFITIAYHFVIGVGLLMLFPEVFEQMQSMINTQATTSS